MTAEPDVVVLGDVNLDWSVTDHLPFSFSDLAENGVITWAGIDEVPGGSGLNFAVFAQEAGCRPLLIGRVGDDPAGAFLRTRLADRGIAAALATDREAGTGRAFIVRDKRDVRLLVNNRGNANDSLRESDIDEHARAIRSCRVLYVSGFCIKEQAAPRHRAALRAMEHAGSSRARPKPVVVFDVVPHRLYEIYSFEQFRTITRHVDVLISEVATMRRFLALGSHDEHVDRSMAEETAGRLGSCFRRLILRFGPSGCDEQLLLDADRDRLSHEQTGHDAMKDKRGFGDFLAVRALKEFFEVLS